MILADTSAWINHLQITNLTISRAIAEEKLLMHPFVAGELAMGSLRSRTKTLMYFADFGQAAIVEHDDVIRLVEQQVLFSRGIGYIDAHLLAACLQHGNCKLLTTDRRLRKAAEELGLAA